jgi:hypothetical protein
MTTPDRPAQISEDMRRLLDAELSVPARLGYVALLLAALMMTAVVLALWLTEPALAVRTQVAFALMIAIGVSWVAFAVRVLTTRRILLARHRIVAARMAVTFTTVFVAGFVTLGFVTGNRAPYAAAALGLVMLTIAASMLRHAHRAFVRLTERRVALERELGRSVR